MRKYIVSTLLGVCFILSACSGESSNDKIRFATSAEYPPFEYKIKGKLTGFDIELATLIAEELGKEAYFEDMQFSAILAALQSGMVDAAISTITITPERQQAFDFSSPYYTESMTMVFPNGKPITQTSEIAGKKIACQLGTTMEIWLKEHAPMAQIITKDNNLQAIEALKAGLVDGVLVDSVQGAVFAKQNDQLSFAVIAQADTGYGIAFKKGSPLTAQVNQALEILEEKGEIQKLKEKYLESDQWQN